MWSPDGKSIAYHARVDGKLQIFTRNADSSGPMQVTRSAESCESPQWSADGRRLFFQSKREVYVVGAAGGAPELLVRDVDFFAASPNGETLAILRRRSNPNGFSILLSSPPGAPPVKYEPAPFEGPDFNAARLSFSPDNKRLLFYVSIVAAGRPSEFWILPPPAGSARPLAKTFPS